MKNILKILATLTAVGIMSGGVLSQIDGWSAPLIAANQKAETERAIFVVQPEGRSYEEVEGLGFQLFKVLTESGELAGYSMVYAGNGFSGKIKMMIGLTNDLNTVKTVEVLDQAETPGLGTKILESPFKDDLENLAVNPAVKLVKGLPASADNEVQSITGATISAKAVVEIINSAVKAIRKAKAEEKI
jgi:Na+-translocating ferredoxin:NAD+ oxidoreductase subunit G